MKTLFPVLLLTMTLHIKNVPSLECYFCNNTSYIGCPAIINCSEHEHFCTRFTVTSLRGFMLQQGCTAKCAIPKTNWPSEYTFFCCQENRCNHVSATRCSKSLLAAAVVFGALTDLAL